MASEPTDPSDLSNLEDMTPEQKATLWDQTEANSWKLFTEHYERLERELKQQHHNTTVELKVALFRLYTDHADLSKSLVALREQCAVREKELDEFDAKLQARLDAVAAERRRRKRERRRWWKDARQGIFREDAEIEQLQLEMGSGESMREGETPRTPFGETTHGPGAEGDLELDSEPHPEPEQRVDREAGQEGREVELAVTNGNTNSNSRAPARPLVHASAKEPTAQPTTLPSPSRAPRRIEVFDGEGKSVGHLRPIGIQNHWVTEVLKLPIKRDVSIRPGRRFTAETLEGIYEPAGTKGAKWIGCYIQATGEVQAQPCQYCATQGGVFSQCVIIGGNDFPRCGDCEWNRRGCHGASLQSRPKSRPSTGEVAQTPFAGRAEHGGAASSGFTAVNNKNGATPRQTRVSQAADIEVEETHSSRQSALHRSRKSGGKDEQQASKDRGTDDEEEIEELSTITAATLVLEHDGNVYTNPPIMRGVPVAKITPNHHYWSPEWKPLEDVIGHELEKWQDKYNKTREDGSTVATKNMAQRQKNRGVAAMDFLRTGEISPYQIIGKQWITTGLANYDTVFRLCQVLHELQKYHIDVTPTQWVRQRLHEIYTEKEAKGETFNLASTLKNFYHDAKLTSLRERSGAKSIGRPLGFKMGDRSAEATPNSKAGTTPRGKKRKELHSASTSQTPNEHAAQHQGSQRHGRRESHGSNGGEQQGSPSAMHGHGKKRRRRGSGADLDFDDVGYYTSRDSVCGDKLSRQDYRVYQVKTQTRATNTKVTQYWHWLDGKDGQLFEHQVLGEIKPIQWGVYKEPVDFHLRLVELERIEHDGDDKIIVRTKKIQGVKREGPVMGHFKRARTMMRFLAFMRGKGVLLVERSKAEIGEEWNNLQPDEMPHYESD